MRGGIVSPELDRHDAFDSRVCRGSLDWSQKAVQAHYTLAKRIGD